MDDTTAFLMGCLFLGLLLCGFIGRAVAAQKDAGTAGFYLGFFLGPLGIVVAALIDGRPLCPNCGGRIQGRPQMCQHCGTRFKWSGKSCEYFPPN